MSLSCVALFIEVHAQGNCPVRRPGRGLGGLTSRYPGSCRYFSVALVGGYKWVRGAIQWLSVSGWVNVTLHAWGFFFNYLFILAALGLRSCRALL